MKLQTIFVALFALFLIPFKTYGSNTLDISQSTGGYLHPFYHDGHSWTKQTFVPEANNLSRVRIKLQCDGTAIYCNPSY